MPNIKSEKLIRPLLVFFILANLLHPININAKENPEQKTRYEIISLIEDRLASAYSIKSSSESPDFGTLDIIYPEWHNGSPVEARRNWSSHNYEKYDVSYVVYSVYENQPGLATAKGEKEIKFSRWYGFWSSPVKMKEEITRKPFTIICVQDASGEWSILSESEQGF